MTSAAQPAPDDLVTPATLPEVVQLWWFCDGAIMDVGTRDHLHHSWGLCPRHAWLYFRAENDLKYQPLGNAVLYEDLTRRAADVLGSHHRPHTKWHRLASTTFCLSCDYLSTSSPGRDRFADDLAAVCAGLRTRSWLTGSTAVWQPRHCPHCPQTSPRVVRGTDRGDTDTDAVTCRMHLLAEPDRCDPAETGRYLDTLADRLADCVKSMTADGPARTPATDAALVEALAWFAGWPPSAGWTAPTTA